eukprot:RCo003531
MKTQYSEALFPSLHMACLWSEPSPSLSFSSPSSIRCLNLCCESHPLLPRAQVQYEALPCPTVYLACNQISQLMGIFIFYFSRSPPEDVFWLPSRAAARARRLYFQLHFRSHMGRTWVQFT